MFPLTNKNYHVGAVLLKIDNYAYRFEITNTGPGRIQVEAKNCGLKGKKFQDYNTVGIKVRILNDIAISTLLITKENNKYK